jgi:hypothetical protein
MTNLAHGVDSEKHIDAENRVASAAPVGVAQHPSTEQPSTEKGRPLLTAISSLATEVAGLHTEGWLHRELPELTHGISMEESPAGPPPAASTLATATLRRDAIVTLAGPVSDTDLCPPELRQCVELEVPARLDDARQLFARNGLLTRPERIDVYQLGVLLCRRATGRSTRTYLSSPRVMRTVSPCIRELIDGCLGYDESLRFETVSDFLEAIQHALSHFASAEASGGSAIVDEERIGATLPESQRNTDAAVSSGSRTVARPPAFLRLGHFEIREVVGRGGMGTVYRAVDHSLQREVAVKVLSSELARDPAFVDRFKAEAAAAAKLAHPNIVPIHFIGEDDGSHYYAMQFVDGESLAERLHRTVRVPPDETLAIVQPLLLGLAAAHRQGLVHRDIKPGNVIIDAHNGRVMLTDFGLARSVIGVGDSSDQNLVMGTAEYMSPEQARGDRVDARSDLYSIGVLIYQLVSGRTPFTADAPTQQLIQHLFDAPKPLQELVPELDPPFFPIVDRLLSKAPEDRYQTVDELLIDLGQLIGTPTSDAVASVSTGHRLPAESLSDPHQNAKVAEQTRASSLKHRAARVAITLAAVVGLAVAWWMLTPAPPLVRTHEDPVTALTFSPDGRFLISGGGHSSSLKEPGDTALRLWDAATGRLLCCSPPLPARATELISFDSRVIALGSTREDAGFSIVWTGDATGQSLGALGPATFTDAFAFQFDAAPMRNSSSANSTTPAAALACGRDGIVSVHLATDGLTAVTEPRLKTSQVVHCVARSAGPAGTAAVAIAVEDKDANGEPRYELVVVSEQTGKQQTLPARGPVAALALSADGRTLVIRYTVISSSGPRAKAADGTLTGTRSAADFVDVLDWREQRLRHRFGPYAPACRALAMSDDGRIILTPGESSTGAASERPQHAVLLDAVEGKTLCRIAPGGRDLICVALSPLEPLAAVADADGQVVFFRFDQFVN